MKSVRHSAFINLLDHLGRINKTDFTSTRQKNQTNGCQLNVYLILTSIPTLLSLLLKHVLCVWKYNCRKQNKAFLVCQSTVIFTKAEGFRFTITSICRLQLLRKSQVFQLDYKGAKCAKSCIAIVYGDKTSYSSDVNFILHI